MKLTKKEQKDFKQYFDKYKDEFTDDEIVGGYLNGMKPGEGASAGDIYGECELVEDTETMDFIDDLDNLAREYRRA